MDEQINRHGLKAIEEQYSKEYNREDAGSAIKNHLLINTMHIKRNKCFIIARYDRMTILTYDEISREGLLIKAMYNLN